MKSLPLRHCRIDCEPGQWVVTHFPDGSQYGAVPHESEEYIRLAHRVGYEPSWPYVPGETAWRYCIEHEIAHAIIAETLYDEPSRVVHGCAIGQYGSMADILHEEALVLELQAFARAGVLPGSSAPGWNWFAVRDRFLGVVE